ncbi:hypothetical protein TWF481_002801 [Arthrobotrys musiformis]|uniref:Uncharacterized protein n=1 Tax=Arthrobotrys musiformis TaxID=47236 RepID=A0AAV9VTA0_9PEZI
MESEQRSTGGSPETQRLVDTSSDIFAEEVSEMVYEIASETRLARDSGYGTPGPILPQNAKTSLSEKEKLRALANILHDFKKRFSPAEASDVASLQQDLQSLRQQNRDLQQEIKRLQLICRDQQKVQNGLYREISELENKRRLTLDFFGYLIETEHKLREMISHSADLEADISKALTQRIEQVEEIFPASPLKRKYWMDSNIELLDQADRERKEALSRRMSLEELDTALATTLMELLDGENTPAGYEATNSTREG